LSTRKKSTRSQFTTKHLADNVEKISGIEYQKIQRIPHDILQSYTLTPHVILWKSVLTLYVDGKKCVIFVKEK